ncbi:RNA polymerase sigma-70 factor [Ravibacter arvi]|uniref:RNA polymerase sigma-70 factor n=1 Tax=Ravibacter arvi TaxID=2051041 RepID=A0ABP8M8Q3_9BACT
MNEVILQQVIKGDRAAFSVLFDHYKGPAMRFCHTIVKDEAEAENMLQDVFIKIWERRHQIKPELNFNSYLYTCLRNVSFDFLKKMEKEQVLKQRYFERMGEQEQDESYEYEIRMSHLDSAVESLSTKRKQILKMSLEENKSYQEIASSLKISKNTVKNQLVKARQFLKVQMEAKYSVG